MKKRQNKRKGFTIIELMLAMGFLSTLLVTIAFLVMQITGIYQKGLSLRAVNSQGKQLIDEFTRVIGGSPIEKITPSTVANAGEAYAKYFYDGRDSNSGVQLRGVFCTGAYSYVWNTKYALSGTSNEFDTSLAMTIRSEKSNGDRAYRLARIRDMDRSMCSQAHGSVSEWDRRDDDRRSLEAGNGAEPIELLHEDDSDLIMYDFTVFPATQNSITGQTFFSATFILATIRGGINIQTNGDFCDVPSRDELDGSEVGSILGLTTDFNYCAVNKFNFAMRATGYSEGEDQFGEKEGGD